MAFEEEYTPGTLLKKGPNAIQFSKADTDIPTVSYQLIPFSASYGGGAVAEANLR